MKKFGSEKRFGLEGGDVTVPLTLQLVDESSKLGVDSFAIAMAHRGRLNTLVNICERPLYKLLAQFNPLKPADEGSGDVKYHLGMQNFIKNEATGKKIKMTVVANPSHLEVNTPVGLGKIFAEQKHRKDAKGEKSLSLCFHGDAAFSGQGIVYEGFHMSYLKNYSTQGAIHIVINNQVGFTTDPRFSRSSRYCTGTI